MQQEKEITVVNLQSKQITPKQGQTFRPFTVYQVAANDNYLYETTDQDHFRTFEVGKVYKIKYRVETKNSNGRIYTSYKLVSPASKDKGIDMSPVFDRLDRMERNIIAAIEINLKGVKTEPVTPDVPHVEVGEDGIPINY